MQDFKENWEMIPIVDITTSPSTCAEGYEELVGARWPGTVTGCD